MNSATQQAIEIVRDHAAYIDYGRQTGRYSLEEGSLSIFATAQILEMLNKNSTDPPLIIMEQFRNRLEGYSKLNKRTSNVFTAMRDAVDNIIDVLISHT